MSSQPEPAERNREISARKTFDQFWTKAEAAERLRCSVASINKWIAEKDPLKRLEMRKAGTRVLIPESAIQDFVDRCTKAAVAPR